MESKPETKGRRGGYRSTAGRKPTSTKIRASKTLFLEREEWQAFENEVQKRKNEDPSTKTTVSSLINTAAASKAKLLQLGQGVYEPWLDSVAGEFKEAAAIIQSFKEARWDQIDPSDPEDDHELNTISEVGRLLSEAADLVDRLNSLIVAKGPLEKLPDGRYALAGRYVYRPEDEIEYLSYTEQGQAWIKTTVKHRGEDYYLAAEPEKPMKGLIVRIRS